MKKRILLLLISASILCGISLKYLTNINDKIKQEANTPVKEIILVDQEQVISESPKVEEPPKELEVVSQEVLEETPPIADSDGWSRYCYDNIGQNNQIVYQEILDILLNFEEDVEISILDAEAIGPIFQAVLNDHPEIFYVQGYNYTKYTKGDKVVQITLTGTYTMNREQAKETKLKIDEYVKTCLSGISMEASDYEKVKYVYEYIINHTEYNQEAPENQNICSVFLYHESVCQGYAKAVQYLLNELNVEATLVIGSVENGEGHAWNLVNMNGNYYYVDATWGDASYQSEETSEDQWTNQFPSINYDYLGVTSEQLLKTHNIDHVVPMPRCIAVDCNYYVMENAYFTEFDEIKLKALFDKKTMKEDGYLTLKCATLEVYNQIKKHLIEEQKIFGYINQADGMVAYSDNETQLSLSFWLTGN